MATLTPEQRQELEKSGNQPLKIEDPETHTEYVIVRAEVYQRLRSLVDIERTDRSLYEFGEFHPDKP